MHIQTALGKDARKETRMQLVRKDAEPRNERFTFGEKRRADDDEDPAGTVSAAVAAAHVADCSVGMSRQRNAKARMHVTDRRATIKTASEFLFLSLLSLVAPFFRRPQPNEHGPALYVLPGAKGENGNRTE